MAAVWFPTKSPGICYFTFKYTFLKKKNKVYGVWRCYYHERWYFFHVNTFERSYLAPKESPEKLLLVVFHHLNSFPQTHLKVAQPYSSSSGTASNFRWHLLHLDTYRGKTKKSYKQPTKQTQKYTKTNYHSE